MVNEWNVRLELLEIAHRWHWVFLAFLLGSALGWGAGLVFPTPYRAETELYIAYNGDATFRNPDDYKNWQLGELETYITSDDVLRAMLDRLVEQDEYWASMSIQELRSQLQTYWRNAGKWRLVAQADQSIHAEQLATTWGDVVTHKVSQAIENGWQVLELSDRNHLLLTRQFDIAQEALVLSHTLEALNAWLLGARQADNQAAVEPLERWRLLSLVASSLQLNPVDASLLEEAPPTQAPVQDYLPWVERAALGAQGQLANLQNQLQDIEAQRQEITEQWEAASAASRNLTVYLTLERITENEIRGVPVRLSSTLALVGGILGALVWAFVWLARPLRRRAA